MATINLLPWRDAYRQEKKRELVSILMLLLIFSAILGYLWVSFEQKQVSDQQARNQIFKNEIKALDAKVAEIDKLKQQRRALESKTEVIQGLQYKRPLVVYYFDEMVRAVPDGVYFKSLSRKEDLYSIKGVSESNSRVSTLMRNLDNSTFFNSPNLINVVKDSFELTVDTVVPDDFSTIGN